MDEDKLISIIKQKLVERNQKEVEIAYQHNCQTALAPNVTIFFETAKINLQQVSIRFIQELYSMKETPWVDWFLIGLSYQVDFNIELNEFVLPFVPWTMLIQWPVTFTISNQRIYAYSNVTLTRQLMICLPQNSILVILNSQKLTQEATEIIKKNNITVIERVNESCIWAK